MNLIKNLNKKINSKKTNYTVNFVCRDRNGNNQHCTITVEKSVTFIGTITSVTVSYIWHNFVSVTTEDKSAIEKEIRKFLRIEVRKKTSN